MLSFAPGKVARLKTLFLDESGDHHLTVIDTSYPVFVLGGVILDADYAAGPLVEAVGDFKRELFGRTDIVLHTADIARNRNGFEALQDAAFRARFYERLNELMRNLVYSVVACAVLKQRFRDLHGIFAPDPYLYGFATLVERFCLDVLESDTGGRIIAERRDSVLDARLQAEWENLKSIGAATCPPDLITARISSLDLYSKKDNVVGLEIADLVVSPIGRHVTGRAGHEDWRIVEYKLLRDEQGQYRNHGLTLLP